MHLEEVAEKTYRLETPIPGIGLIFTVYLIDTEEGVLIEPGPATAIPTIKEGMKKIGMDHLSYIIPTHIHMDHAGGTGTLSDMFPRARVVLHPLSVRHVTDPSRLIQGTRETYGEDFESRYGPITAVPESRIMVPRDRDLIDIGGREIQVIYTPGHAPHHIAVFDQATRGLFCGEALGMDTKDPLPAAAAPSFNLEDYLQTMEKLKFLQPEMLFYSHGGVAREPARIIDQAMDNTRSMGNVILKSLKRGDPTPAIVRQVMHHTSSFIPTHWEEEMLLVWQTGAVHGYSTYFKKKGMF